MAPQQQTIDYSTPTKKAQEAGQKTWTDWAQQRVMRLHPNGALEAASTMSRKAGVAFLIGTFADGYEVVSEIPAMGMPTPCKRPAAAAVDADDEAECSEDESEDLEDKAPSVVRRRVTGKQPPEAWTRGKGPATSKSKAAVAKSPMKSAGGKPSRSRVVHGADDLIEKETLVKKGPYKNKSYLVHKKPPTLVVCVTEAQHEEHYDIVCKVYKYIMDTEPVTKGEAVKKRDALVASP